MPINAYWIGMEEMLWHGFHFSATSIPMNVIFIIFVLALLNYIAQRFFPAYALSQIELLVNLCHAGVCYSGGCSR